MDIGRININNPVNQSDYSRSSGENPVKTESAVDDSTVDKKQAGDVSQKKLEASVDIANKVLFKNNTHLKFEIHEKTKDVMVSIIDDNTGEVLKEIPPEKMLDMVAKLWEIAGIIIDEKR